MRKTKFANNEYYHIYNRGVDKREIFCEEKDYLRFLKSIREFNDNTGYFQRDYEKRTKLTGQKSDFRYLKSDFEQLVEIICYCLNPNHYHFILKQLAENGITLFMRKLGTGYTNYFNKKYNRSGSLFQGKFKSVHIDSNEYLLWLSGYVNGNIEIHGIDKAKKHKWCSYSDYLGKRKGTLCKKEIVLSQFKNLEEYENFVEMTIRKSKERKDLEKYFIE